MIETIILILFLLAILFVAMAAPKRSDKKEKDPIAAPKRSDKKQKDSDSDSPGK